MRMLLVLCWLSLPLVAWAYHAGPGQEQVVLDEAGTLLRTGESAEKAGDYELAKKSYAEALLKLPADRKAEQFAIRLALAKAQMQSRQLPEARQGLATLLAEMQAEPGATPQLLDDTRNTLAQAQYYMTWLLRLEGAPTAEWEPEIEAARQHYRLLAEQAREQKPTAGVSPHQHDLEATIRLARMDLAELQALNLPSQCQGCCSGQCQKPGKKPGKQGQKPQKGPNAGMGPIPEGSGS